MQVTALLECFEHFSGRIQQYCKELLCYKAQPVYSHDDLIKQFPLVVPVSAFHSRPVPIFLEFYLLAQSHICVQFDAFLTNCTTSPFFVCLLKH